MGSAELSSAKTELLLLQGASPPPAHRQPRDIGYGCTAGKPGPGLITTWQVRPEECIMLDQWQCLRRSSRNQQYGYDVASRHVVSSTDHEIYAHAGWLVTCRGSSWSGSCPIGCASWAAVLVLAVVSFRVGRHLPPFHLPSRKRSLSDARHACVPFSTHEQPTRASVCPSVGSRSDTCRNRPGSPSLQMLTELVMRQA